MGIANKFGAHKKVIGGLSWDEDDPSTAPIPVALRVNENGEIYIVNANEEVNVITLSDIYSTFTGILKELKIMNVQLALLTDTNVTAEDVE